MRIKSHKSKKRLVGSRSWEFSHFTPRPDQKMGINKKTKEQYLLLDKPHPSPGPPFCLLLNTETNLIIESLTLLFVSSLRLQWALQCDPFSLTRQGKLEILTACCLTNNRTEKDGSTLEG